MIAATTMTRPPTPNHDDGSKSASSIRSLFLPQLVSAVAVRAQGAKINGPSEPARSPSQTTASSSDYRITAGPQQGQGPSRCRSSTAIGLSLFVGADSRPARQLQRTGAATCAK